MKRFKSSFIVVLLLVLSIAFVGCNSSEKSYNLERVNNAYITLDINPSIEIITNEEGLVDQVNGLNDDAIKLLVDTDFTGQSVDLVIDAILELAIEFGYIDFELENAILVTTGAETPEETEELEKQVSDKVQDFVDARKIKIDVLKASLEATEDIKAVAEQYAISVGKVKIITYAMAIDTELTLEAAAAMHIRDLNRIIKEDRREVKEFYSEEIRKDYKLSKEQIKVEYELELRGLLNNAIQEAASETFENLLIDTDVTVDEVKALYQEYYNALLEVELPVDQVEEEQEEDPSVDPADQARLEELFILRDKLAKEFEELVKQVRSSRKDSLTDEQIDALLARMKEVILERKEVMLEINELSVTVQREHKGNGFGFKWRDGKDKDDDDDVELEDLYEEVEETYEDLFEDLGIELEDLEEIFEDLLVQEIEELKAAKAKELASIHETFKTDSTAIKAQIKEENEILRKIWK